MPVPNLTPDNFARYVFAELSRMPITERVEVLSDDSARVSLKNGQQFTVAVVHGKPKTRRQDPSD